MAPSEIFPRRASCLGVQLWDFEGFGDLVLAAFMVGWVLELGEGAFGDAEFFESLDFVEEFVGV